MDTDFPFVKVPPELHGIIGKPDRGTRIYRKEGTHEELEGWYDAICEHVTPSCVSPGGVSMFAPVSRAGVHKKVHEGKLTAFCFHVSGYETTLFGYQRKLKANPYIYIPVSECKAWAKELALRADRQAALEATGGEKPDERGAFLDKDPADKRGVKYLPDPYDVVRRVARKKRRK